MKKAIVVASFGCSIKDSRERYIETIENAVKGKYKNIDCFRVFTSEIIRRKMKREENLDIHNMKSCLQKLKEENYTHVYVSVTHVVPGFEYEKVLRAVNEYKDSFEEIKTARTFLDDHMGEDEINVIKSYIKTDLNDDEAVILVGHGTGHEAHKYYEQIEKLLRMDTSNIHIANIEGNPYIDDIMDKLKAEKYKKIYLYPLLIVSGDHALNDIGSDDVESIKSKIAANGINVEMFFTGLGENENAVNLFVGRLNEILTV
ncbi:sirohydrochlorin cobaltochelatase [Sedimentibacter hydroxybenzoicus DSM 7310]|uniref:Sirohydrochlorin cobaltochelatase n=1 Tax=Sedimentibacter hydroxybenzoicus DSM 7310 TaxID=1123245 RepID=A0A974BKW1_SEDHY|nr:sirohydrochlorin cobaltochelatase [Sedimentibacter hydroxybenzoicus]NYB75033.1 sirohydrochlorin cobaltochelatase [Sedimentibacter hydroxybenzoicus DSM 7310]